MSETGNYAIGRALYEIRPGQFRRSWRGVISGLALFVGVGGPALLLFVTVTTPGASIPTQFYSISAVFVLFGFAIYVLAVPLNRFGIYEAAIAPTRRTFREGIRLRGRQWLVPYSEVTRITRHGKWAEDRRPQDQTWYFAIESVKGGQLILPAVGIWEAISPKLGPSKRAHREQLRLAYEALDWVATKHSAGEHTKATEQDGRFLVSEAEFKTSRAGTGPKENSP